MNISKDEQRVLHVLAQGGHIHYDRGSGGRILQVQCFTREGHVLTACTFETFRKLLRKRLIRSRASMPYRISELGRRTVRSQHDNR